MRGNLHGTRLVHRSRESCVMPTYRTPGGFVHIKMTNTKKRPAPLPCCAIVDHDGRRQRCMAISTLLCDWPLIEGGTCDAPLCAEHGHEIAADRHLCPIHLARQRHGQREIF